MSIEDRIAERIEDRGVPISTVARRTGIPYTALFNSLANKNRTRELRGKELLSICAFLGVDPMEFADKETGGR